VLVVEKSNDLVDRWTLDRVARYEATVLLNVDDAIDELTTEAIDAVVVTDQTEPDEILQLLRASRDQQPEAVRLLAYHEDPTVQLLQDLINDGGLDGLFESPGVDDPLGDALDRIFLQARDELSPVALKDEVRQLRQQVRALQESLTANTADLKTKAEALDKKASQLKTTQMALVGISGELQETNTKLEQTRGQLDDLLVIDTLTGAPNRTEFYQRLEDALTQAQQSDQDLGLLLVNVEELATVNTTHGYLAGDAVLQAVTSEIKKLIAAKGSLGRLAGGEFGILLDGASLDACTELAQRIVQAVDAHDFELPGDNPVPVSVTVGAASTGDLVPDNLTLLNFVHAAQASLRLSLANAGNSVRDSHPDSTS
jgi:diguanylate cyclase (GGDEF)-like protein